MKIELSEAQKSIISHRGADLQIIACAGAGKIESISRRVASLLAEGVLPEAIVAFTFTEKAGSELKPVVIIVRDAIFAVFADIVTDQLNKQWSQANEKW